KSLELLSTTLCSHGKYAEAETRGREAVALHERLLGKEHPTTARAKRLLATAIYRQRRFAEAEALSRQALATERACSNEGAELTWALELLAECLARQGKIDETERLAEEMLAICTNGPPNFKFVLRVAGQLGRPLESGGRLGLARRLYHESLVAGDFN